MNQQLANQINAATSAKQAQLRAIQAGLANKNKTKPVSTVEPFQRSLQSGQQQQLDNNPHVSAEDLKPGLAMLPGDQLHQQQLPDGGNGTNNNNAINNKNMDPKYQTLPYNTKFSQLNNSHNNNNASVANARAQKIEQLKQEKENNNVAFAEALPRPPPPMVYGPPRPGVSGGPEFHVNGGSGGNYGQGIGVVAPLPAHHHAETSVHMASNLLAVTAGAPKPVSSVAPVFATSSLSSLSSGSVANNGLSSNNASRYGTPQTSGNLSMMTPPRLSSTPLSAASIPGYAAPPHDLQRLGQASPTKLRPALPPKPVMPPAPPPPPSSGTQQQQPPVHGEEGTSVDDVEDLPPPPPTTEPPADSPTPEVDFLNGNSVGGGSKDMSVSVSGAFQENSGGLMVASTGAGEGGVHVSINR